MGAKLLIKPKMIAFLKKVFILIGKVGYSVNNFPRGHVVLLMRLIFASII
jgi:hypothetical protein